MFVEAIINGKKFKFELADSFFKKVRGLMFRKDLKEYDGMLFIFEKEDYHKFWNLNIKFPIEIIWISKSKRVIEYKTMEPGKIKIFKPSKKSLYVLEVKKGFIKRNNIKIGTKINLEL